MKKSVEQRNIINFMFISGAIALIDLRGCISVDRERMKKVAEENDSILMCLKYADFKKTVDGTIFDVFVPEIPKEIGMILSRNEEELDSALEKALAVRAFTVDHRIIRE